MDSTSTKATRGAKWLLFFNIFQKLLTFSVNQLTVRHSRPEVFGVAAVQLELLLSSLLFLSREGVRLAVLRRGVESRVELCRVVNVSWVPVGVVAGLSCALYFFCPSLVGE
jgi:oligosaccharide translocation protein RFT1